MASRKYCKGSKLLIRRTEPGDMVRVHVVKKDKEERKEIFEEFSRILARLQVQSGVKDLIFDKINKYSDWANVRIHCSWTFFLEQKHRIILKKLSVSLNVSFCKKKKYVKISSGESLNLSLPETS